MRVVIIDDEVLARNTMKNILHRNHPDLEIVGEADAVSEAVKVILEQNPDLVFLDIDLKDGSGFDVLNALDEIKFKTIFATAHHEYAIKAIKFSALDYILKPVSEIEVRAAIERVKIQGLTENQNTQFEVLKNNYQNSTDKKIVLKTSESIHLVRVQDVIRCEADNNYTTFFINGNRKIVVSKGLKEYEELLTTFAFLRVHQSHLINVKEIKRFDKKDGGFVVLSDGSEIPVSQRKKQKLLDVFESL